MPGEERRVVFPLSEAFAFSLESVKKRFSRVALTLVAVILSVAFFVYFLTTSAILRVVAGTVGAVSAYQQWVAYLALLICAIGIVNAMLMEVSERYKEIGTIKCLGALDRHVMTIFLAEALIIGALGGVVGSCLGLLIAVVANAHHFDTIASLAPDIALYFSLGIAVSLMLSLTATLLPAYEAAKLNPAEALRREV